MAARDLTEMERLQHRLKLVGDSVVGLRIKHAELDVKLVELEVRLRNLETYVKQALGYE